MRVSTGSFKINVIFNTPIKSCQTFFYRLFLVKWYSLVCEILWKNIPFNVKSVQKFQRASLIFCVLKNVKILWKSRIKQTSVLFCKYLANESLDLHEILCGGQLLSCELKFQISWRFVDKFACLSCNDACARFIAKLTTT